ncbi:MAG: hypothetical protein ACYC05_15090 [Sulfuricella sp.]
MERAALEAIERRANELGLTTIKTNDSDQDTALLSLSPRMNAGAGVDFSTADAVVRRVVAAKKGWNVEIGTFAAFDALPLEVKEAAIKDYGEEDAKKATGIVHDGKVYIVAENNESEADVEATVLHEVEGHIGRKGGETTLVRQEPTGAIPESDWLSVGALEEEVGNLLKPFATEIPVLIRDTARSAGIKGPDNGVASGAVYNGRIHLFRDGLADRAAMVRAMWHELLHFGFRRFMTEEQYITKMGGLYMRDGCPSVKCIAC